MLILSRKLGEKLVINNNVVLTVVEIRGDKVRLGVEAPKEVSVHRQEVWDRIHQGDANAGSQTPGGSDSKALNPKAGPEDRHEDGEADSRWG